MAIRRNLLSNFLPRQKESKFLDRLEWKQDKGRNQEIDVTGYWAIFFALTREKER